nr:uncharacterized protein LOC109150405 [Ipomoea batatas]
MHVASPSAPNDVPWGVFPVNVNGAPAVTPPAIPLAEEPPHLAIQAPAVSAQTQSQSTGTPEILNLLDGEEIARSVYYFPHSELRPAWGIIFCGMHFRYSGFHSIKTWGTSCSFSDIAQKKTKLAPLQRQTGTGIGLQEILGRVPLSSKKEKEKALIMTITVDAFCKLVKNQADVAQLITK